MARPRTFEPDDVVQAAMECFREHGYRATSIRDLESATGLKAASLYHAFGNKASLFETALARYRSNVVPRRIATHLRQELGLSGIRTFFSSTYTSEPEPTHGCMLANAALDSDALNDPARTQLRLGLSEIRGAFVEQIVHCVETGEVHSFVDARLAADLLLVLYQGQLGLMRNKNSVRGIDFDSVVVAVLDQLPRNYTTQETTP